MCVRVYVCVYLFTLCFNGHIFGAGGQNKVKVMPFIILDAKSP